MKILVEPVSVAALEEIAQNIYGDMVKAVADVGRGVVAVDAELHSDLEQMLLENGSLQEDIWGFNIYPSIDGEEFIEFDSLINIRPRQDNASRDVLNPGVRKRIVELVNKYVQR